MSERHKTHNGRDLSGNFKVRQVDVEELRTDPRGEEYFRDDVRLGGAVADTSLEGVRRAERIHDLVENNRANVNKAVGRTGRGRKGNRSR
jgi:hypothetical protein